MNVNVSVWRDNTSLTYMQWIKWTAGSFSYTLSTAASHGVGVNTAKLKYTYSPQIFLFLFPVFRGTAKLEKLIFFLAA